METVEIEALCGLGVPVIDDVGSGALAAEIEDEPTVPRSIAAEPHWSASAATSCSVAQAGLLVGTAEAVAVARAHPLARALRMDKLSLAALEATLRAPEETPVAQMLAADTSERATRLAEGIGTVVEGIGRVGGGALPLTELAGPVVAVDTTDPEGVAAALRTGDPPVLARIDAGRLLLDPRTLTDGEAEVVRQLVDNILSR